MHQLPPQKLRNNLTGDVIGGGPESSRDDQDIGSVKGLDEEIPDGRAIRNRRLPADPQAKGKEFPAKPREVGVADGPEKQFASGIDDLDPRGGHS